MHVEVNRLFRDNFWPVSVKRAELWQNWHGSIELSKTFHFTYIMGEKDFSNFVIFYLSKKCGHAKFQAQSPIVGSQHPSPPLRGKTNKNATIKSYIIPDIPVKYCKQPTVGATLEPQTYCRTSISQYLKVVSLLKRIKLRGISNALLRILHLYWCIWGYWDGRIHSFINKVVPECVYLPTYTPGKKESKTSGCLVSCTMNCLTIALCMHWSALDVYIHSGEYWNKC